ncbi:MAG: HD domain-containing protein [Candidatus Omnitrophica bacterium]|nr:HD domain-containing protein [Candidatus Omnitrophota bacterium]
MRAAVIDIGSSSIKLIIGEKVEDELKILEFLKNVVNIGEYTFYKGRISQTIINDTIKIIENYKKIISDYSIAQVKVIATAAVSEANNKDIFLDTVYRKCGFEIDVLNVGDVVYYIDSFLSFKLKQAYPINEKNLLIAELGAGGLDLSVLEKGFTVMNFGIPIGTLRLRQFKKRFNCNLKDTMLALEEFVENYIMTAKGMLPDVKIDDVILIDESYSTTVKHILPDENRPQNFFQLKHRESIQLLSKIQGYNLSDLAYRFHLSPDIAETIDTYAIILNKLFKLTKLRKIYILETSLSQALLANMLFDYEISKKYNKPNQLISVAKHLCAKFRSDSKHSRHVALLSEKLFGYLKETLGLAQEDQLYLLLAAYLHNIGLFINNRAHHKHAEYIISNLNLFRLTEVEIKVISCIARYHRKAPPRNTHNVYNSLPPDEKILVQKLSAILRLANALDSAHKQKIKDLDVLISANQEILIHIYSTENVTLELVNFDAQKELFEEISGNKVVLKVKKNK